MRFGAVFGNQESYGAVRFGFEEGKYPTVRFGAVNHADPHRTDRKNRTVKNPGFLHIMGGVLLLYYILILVRGVFYCVLSIHPGPNKRVNNAK